MFRYRYFVQIPPIMVMITFIWRYSLLSSRLTALLSHVILNERLSSFMALFSTSIKVVYLQRYLVVTWLVPSEAAAALAHVLCIHHRLPPCTSLQCHFMQSHILRVHVCSAVTCHLHFWQNDREYFHSTAVTQGWKGYRNKSQHRMDPSTAPPLSRCYRKVSQAAAGKRACEPV